MAVQSKHFVNEPSSLVLESLIGLCAINPHLVLDPEYKVVSLNSLEFDRHKVSLICGGGSGHEPAHAGYVGGGMLSAAVCGDIFASPNARQIRRAIDLVDSDKGTVIIVKNYTGDVLNFGLAKEQYAAEHPDAAACVRIVTVQDDVSVGKTQGQIVGRRGLAGTVLVYKIAGALAKRGASLDEVHSIAEYVASRIGTIGVGLEHCHVPGTAVSESHLSPSEIEIGMGIHNESGHRRLSPAPPLGELVSQLLDLLTSTNDQERSFLPFEDNGKDRVVLMINNLGGVSELELCGIVREARMQLEDRSITIERIFAGTFMTSLNMPGFSITVLLLPNASKARPSDPSASLLLELLDEKPKAPGWKWSPASVPSFPPDHSCEAETARTPDADITTPGGTLTAMEPASFVLSIRHACEALIAAEPDITRMDTIAGDGDCGQTLKSGASGVLRRLNDGGITGSDVVSDVIAIARIADEHMGGTSGALYSIFFSALAQGLRSVPEGSELTRAVWAAALQSALDKLYTYTRARPPSRTLVDPLEAFIVSIGQESIAVGEAVRAAAESAEKTKDLEAKAGRSAYLGDQLRGEQVPDPGAWGVKVILEALLA